MKVAPNDISKQNELDEASELKSQNKKLEIEARGLRETLRDQFAMAALTGLMSRTTDAISAANIAYEAADEMLKSR